ncbi:MAG: translocation/assembly module TamB [Balneolaceae bacterium]|nr:translocation/assembly module TamB [Balneolaceae bacterium]
MEQTQQPHIAARLLKSLGWTLLILLILGGAVRWLLTTDWATNMVREKAISTANQQLDGTLGIGKMKGDLWDEVTITDITIVATDTVFKADSLTMNYEILSLLTGSFTINKLKVSHFHSFIKETDTTSQSFNVMQMMQQDTSQPKEENSGFGFHIEQLLMEEGRISVYSPSYLPDSSLKLQHIKAEALLSIEDEVSAGLKSLTFELKEGRLPEPIQVTAAARYQNEYISLQDLAIETGRSLLTVQGAVQLSDTTISGNAQTSPFALADIRPYLEQKLPNDKLDLSITASGSVDSLHLNIEADGQGFDDLVVVSDLSFRGQPTAQLLGINVRNIDLGYFTDDSMDAYLGEFRASVDGKITDSLQAIDVSWGFSFYNVRYQEYRIKHAFGSGTLVEGLLLSHFQLQDGEDMISVIPTVKDVFSDHPEWEAEVRVNTVDAGWWLRNPDFKSNISLRGHVKGSGYQLSDTAWTFRFRDVNSYRGKIGLSFPKSFTTSDGKMVKFSKERMERILQRERQERLKHTLRFGDQAFSALEIKGSIDQDSLIAEGFLKLEESRINFKTALAAFTSPKPSFTYSASASEFDLREVAGLDSMPSSINISAEGDGLYFDPEQMVMESHLKMDSSIVNGALVHNVEVGLSLKNGVCIIPEGVLESQLVSGNFSARKNIMDKTDPENKLKMDFEIKNLQPLAPFAEVDELRATGHLCGEISERDSASLGFKGILDLHDVNYDSLFIAESAEGEVAIGISEHTDYNLNLTIGAPVIGGIALQDMKLETEGTGNPDSLSGNFALTINSKDAGQISQGGSYKLAVNNLEANLIWDQFRFVTPVRTLNIEQPFHFSYANQTVRTDTLMMSSEDGSYLRLAVPLADSLNQDIWVKGHNFDFGVIQEILLGQKVIDGILQGELEVSRTRTDLTAYGQLNIADLNYMDAQIDQFDLNFEIAKDRLTAKMISTIDGKEKINGSLDVPFKLGDPAGFEDEFFNEPVQGELVVKPLDLARFNQLLQKFEINETRGEVTFNGKLSGVAGEPTMEGRLLLQKPTLSGIDIDSASVEFEYDHRNTSLKTIAGIQAKGNSEASVDANIPMFIDFRTFQFSMPGAADTISVDMKTEDFNLTVFNDFLNEETLKDLRGTLNAEINIEGTKEEMTPKGYLKLTNGHVFVPVAGITLDGIQSEIDFSDAGLILKELKANSGKGTFQATGAIKFNGLKPASLDIDARARQFKLANTSNYNLNIDLDSKLSGNPLKPKATGKLTVRNGFILLKDFGEKSVEKIVLEDEDEINFSPYDSLAMDMEVVIEDNFYVRNRKYLDMEIEFTGSMNAYKETSKDLQLFGTLTGEDGYARPLEKLFELEEARFSFSGQPENPQLLIRTSYAPPSPQKQGEIITIYYIVEGTAQSPEFRFESDPPMEQQDIICYTLFNKPCYSLDSWQQVVTSGSGGTSPTGLLVDVLLDEVESLATRELGIDVVQIDNSGSEEGTSIKTGWYLNQRTFFAIVNQISASDPQTLFILEYMLDKNLDLIITQGGNNRQGIDLRWQFDY